MRKFPKICSLRNLSEINQNPSQTKMDTQILTTNQYQKFIRYLNSLILLGEVN